MDSRKEVQPTAEELSDQLLALGVSEETIAAATQRAVTAHAEAKERETWDTSVREFAAAYKRVDSDEPNDSGIEGWFEALTYGAHDVLEQAAERSDLSELDQEIIKAAAVTYIYEQCEMGWIEDYGDSVDLDELLTRGGVDPVALREEFRAAFSAIANPSSDPARQARIDQDFTRFVDMSGLWGGSTKMWNAMMRPVVGKMYDDLTASGFELPVLGEDGLYDDERDDH